jgi:hypothetical protein
MSKPGAINRYAPESATSLLPQEEGPEISSLRPSVVQHQETLVSRAGGYMKTRGESLNSCLEIQHIEDDATVE